MYETEKAHREKEDIYFFHSHLPRRSRHPKCWIMNILKIDFVLQFLVNFAYVLIDAVPQFKFRPTFVPLLFYIPYVIFFM